MSTALAVAAVTAALRQLFIEFFNERDVRTQIGGRDIVFSAQPPGTIATGNGESLRLNIFLYQTAVNSGWINVGLPVRSGRAQRVNAPPLALDLHYLLTAYASEDFDAEVILGFAMQMLHEQPGLGRRKLRELAIGGSADPLPLLAAANLSEQAEQVKFTPQAMSGEEMSKLWTAFQAQYRPSAAYHASVVLIESEFPTRSALPVREPRLHVRPLRRPHIDAVTPQIATAGAALTLSGHSLSADDVQIAFGGQPPVTVLSIGDQSLEVNLPAALRSGINTVQVVHPIDVDPGPEREFRRGAESNVVAFMLAPRIVTGPTVTPEPESRLITLSVDPPAENDQRVELLLGSQAFPGETISGELHFRIPNAVASGDYLIRVRVDGAESALMVDSDPASPSYNEYTGPEVTIP